MLLTFAAGIVRAQEHCAELRPKQSIEVLQDRVRAAQDDLARVGVSDSADVRKKQEQLLSALEDLECKEENSVSAQKGILTTSTFVQVPLLFVTDRQRRGDYTSEAAKTLEFGRVNTVINEIGSIRTSLIAGTRRVNAPKAMGRAQVQPSQQVAEATFSSLLVASAPGGAAQPHRVLLFVHGFNVEFYEAALSMARLATSMQVPLVPVFYSWPSEGKVLGYWHDEDAVTAAAVRFTPFLERLLNGPVDDVTIVCHSMGSRIVTRSLGELARRNAKLHALKKVVFAAADINTQELDAQWPYLKQISGVQWAFYESSGDLALRLSKFVHNFRRVGESDGGVYVADGSDTIDASSTTSILRTLGHSYIISSPALAGDIGDWITQDLPPANRGLQRLTQGASVYWKIP